MFTSWLSLPPRGSAYRYKTHVTLSPSFLIDGSTSPSPSRPATVAEPPELSRLKCTGHHHKGNIDSNSLQTEQFLVCRVMSRYNHRFSDRTSIPRTKASPEISQPYILQHRHNITVITISLKHYYRSKLSKSLDKT